MENRIVQLLQPNYRMILSKRLASCVSTHETQLYVPTCLVPTEVILMFLLLMSLFLTLQASFDATNGEI